MNILHVTPYFYGAWAYGGIPRLSWHLAAAQAALGHTVDAVTTDARDAERRLDPGDCEREGVRVRVYRNLSNDLAYRLQLFWPLGIGAERERIRDYDIVLLHGHRNFHNSLMADYAFRAGKPYVLMPNGTLVNIERRRALKWGYDLLLGRKQVARASGFIAVSEAERAQMLGLSVPADKIRVIPDGVEMDCDPAGMSFKREHGIAGDYLLYLGKITPRKGIDHIIRALPFIPDGKLILVVAGNDMGYKRDLIKLAAVLGVEHRVRFTGLVTGPMKAAALREALYTLYAGRDEIFGLVPWESILCGTPTIVADDCGCGEWIRAAGAGRLVPYGDPRALAAAIEDRDPERDRALTARGAAFCRERFNWARVAAEMVEYYQEVLG